MKVLVVDDHPLVREAVRNVVVEIDAACELIEAADGAGALEAAARVDDIDLILLDLNLPDCDGAALIRQLRRTRPATAVVVLSAQTERRHVTQAIELGAAGYIPKSTAREVMVQALKLVCAGGVYLPPQVLPEACRAPDEPRLTGRERDVLALMLQGKSNKRISNELGMAEATVKNHVTAILKALDATNRTEAVLAANRLGLTREALRGGGS